MTHVAVVVPGIMASVLSLGQEVIWPGRVSNLVLGFSRMADLLREDLIATDVIRSYLISRQYADLLEDLATCGFREDDDLPTLYPFPYDWRKSNALAAAGLADLLDGIVEKNGPGTEISIIAHSMGGLIARYCLESQGSGSRPGRDAVRRLVTLGTPHRGAPLVLTAAVGQERRLFLSRGQVLQIASDPRYPSLYELLPPEGEPFAWNEAAGSEFDPVDVYEATVSMRLGLVGANLEAAKGFRSGLDLAARPKNVRYFWFAGSRQKTITAVMLLETGARYRVRAREADDAGDGTVPTWSGSVTGIQGLPVGGEHSTIYRNDDLRRTLAGLLGRPGVLAAAPGRTEVAVRERVVEPGQSFHVTLAFGTGTERVKGELRIRKADIADDGTVEGIRPAASTHRVEYSGVAADTLGLTVVAPDAPGAYEIAFHGDDADEATGTDEIFVQAPPV